MKQKTASSFFIARSSVLEFINEFVISFLRVQGYPGPRSMFPPLGGGILINSPKFSGHAFL